MGLILSNLGGDHGDSNPTFSTVARSSYDLSRAYSRNGCERCGELESVSISETAELVRRRNVSEHSPSIEGVSFLSLRLEDPESIRSLIEHGPCRAILHSPAMS